MTEIAPNIVVDPNVRFGQPIIKDTRITVDEVLGYLAGGMDFDEIKQEYGLTKAQVRAAVSYASDFLRGEEVESPA